MSNYARALAPKDHECYRRTFEDFFLSWVLSMCLITCSQRCCCLLYLNPVELESTSRISILTTVHITPGYFGACKLSNLMFSACLLVCMIGGGHYFRCLLDDISCKRVYMGDGRHISRDNNCKQTAFAYCFWSTLAWYVWLEYENGTGVLLFVCWLCKKKGRVRNSDDALNRWNHAIMQLHEPVQWQAHGALPFHHFHLFSHALIS